ncbi:3-phosphoglycerate dehydrogenase [Aureimonas sp. Leaf454]|nr:3-phosphoglycerate dehydrogenase [Aureimonas sp. Leaf454]
MMGGPAIETDILAPTADVEFFDARSEADLDVERLARVDALMVWGVPLGRRSVDHLHRCRAVVRYGVGYEKVDRAALADAGIPFANNPDYGTEEVADHAVAMILSLQRRLWEHDHRSRRHTTSWQANTLSPLHRSSGATVGVVGAGRIGTAVINRLKPFGYRIVVFDPDQPPGHEKAIGYERVPDLASLLKVSDVVTLHCPATADTRGMIDRTALDGLKPGAILVNTARGDLLDGLDAVESSLRSGRLAAAALDVLAQEPPEDHPLLDAWRERADWLAGRLVITPHNAFHSDASGVEMRRNAADTVRMFLEGRGLRNRVEPD